MDKEKIMNQLQQKMQETYLHAEIVECFGALVLKAEGEIIAWFRDWDPDRYYMECSPEITEWALSNGILLEFYKEGRKLLKKPIKKYRIKLWKGEAEETDNGYLNICYRTNGIAISDKYELGDWRTSFTKKEIEELKKRDDIAIDWDKVEIEEVDDE